MATQKLILQYFYSDSEDWVGDWEYILPFEYSSKEQFVLDVIDNHQLLQPFNLCSDWEFKQPKLIEALIEEIRIYTLDEWFEKSLITI
jgi:hypothetical protein